MPRKKKLSPDQQLAQEAEVLNKPADLSNQAVKALMSPEFEQMSNLDAAQIALILQEVVRGQKSMIANYNETNTQIARILERQEKIDQEIAARLEEQKKFVEDVLDKAESIRRTGDANDKLIAKGVQQYQEALTVAKADRISKNLEFRRKLANEEKITIVSPGQLVTTMENGQQVTRIAPEEVHIMDMHFAIPVGEPIALPRTIVNYLEQRRASQRETRARQEVLSKNMESTKLAEAWGGIEGSRAERMPI